MAVRLKLGLAPRSPTTRALESRDNKTWKMHRLLSVLEIADRAGHDVADFMRRYGDEVEEEPYEGNVCMLAVDHDIVLQWGQYYGVIGEGDKEANFPEST